MTTKRPPLPKRVTEKAREGDLGFPCMDSLSQGRTGGSESLKVLEVWAVVK